MANDSKRVVRDKWEIEDDLKAFQRVRVILKDPARTADMKKLATEKIEETDANKSLIDGDMSLALGL